MAKNDDHRIPSLDGLRAVSIAFVLFGHLSGTRGFLSAAAYEQIGDLASLGVRVFFVISGYLITTLLLQEVAGHGTISLRRFYLRRSLRIFPPFYVFLGCMAVASALSWVYMRPVDFVRAATYTVNVHFDPSWCIGHLWSLSTEEQFYLLWPALLLLLGLRGAVYAAAIGMSLPFLRFILLHEFPAFAGEGWQFVSPNGMDTISAGCLLALTRDRLSRSRLYLWLKDPITVWIFAIPLIAHVHTSTGRIHFVSGFLLGPCLAIMIDSFITHPGRSIGPFLNLSPVRWVGVLSYSLYLWQQPFLDRSATTLPTSFPINILLVFAFACASYYLVEKPALNFRRRIERRDVGLDAGNRRYGVLSYRMKRVK